MHGAATAARDAHALVALLYLDFGELVLLEQSR
jgi:hypothetical protein